MRVTAESAASATARWFITAISDVIKPLPGRLPASPSRACHSPGVAERRDRPSWLGAAGLSSPACGGGGSPRTKSEGETEGGFLQSPFRLARERLARHLPRKQGRTIEGCFPIA